jgi:NAD(P)-dependent dehydrogenase (short-subunit alcohol dehydrogenase family)
MDFSGQVAIVTGGAGDIGRAVAELLGRRGARIVIGDIQQQRGAETVGLLRAQGIEVEFLKTDVTLVEDLKRLVDKTVDAHEKLDILVNCAGISSLSRVPDVSPQEWDRVLAINLRATFFASQQALRHMCERKQGRIVNIASASGKVGGVVVGPHYAASKAAVICLTKSLAQYAAPFHVLVNCVCPGPTVSALTDEWGAEVNASFIEKIPLKRYATPGEVAQAVVFLVSDAAQYITGETLDVNGGLVMD